MKDLTGRKVGKVLVLGKTDMRTKQGNIVWKCQCDCGEIMYKRGSHLQDTDYLLGCKKCRSQKIYPDEDRRLYKIWRSIKNRGSNPNVKNYCGRGIIICEEWKNNFFAFRDWAYANGYDKNAEFFKCTIDRIDNNGNYEPNNCRWVDMGEQNCNKRDNHYITLNGKTQCVKKWLDELGVSRGLFYGRKRRNWSDEKALLEPISIKNRSKSKRGE